jgi:aminopeptidase YwaD
LKPYTGELPPVSASQLRRHVESVALVRNQVLNPGAIKKTLRYIEADMGSAGLSVRKEAFYSWLSPWSPQHNLIATLDSGPAERSDPEHSRVIIGAHYDSVPFSPGADDNASGVAILIEVAKVCIRSGVTPARPIDFIAFGMEEEGCIGSCRHATRLVKTGTKLAGMVSLECVGYTNQAPGSQVVPPGLPIEVPDRGTFLGVIGNRQASELVGLMTTSAHAQAPDLQAIGLVVENNGRQLPATRLSDHAPFWDRGFPAMMLTDTAFMRNPNYHRSSDLPETLDYEFMARTARSVAAFTLALATY